MTDAEREPWRPTAAQGETVDNLPLKEWVGQALGAASSCWENLEGAGAFDSSRCAWIFDGLMERVECEEQKQLWLTNTLDVDVKRYRQARELMVDSEKTYKRLAAEADTRLSSWDVMYVRHRRVALVFLPIYILMLAFSLMEVIRVDRAGLYSTAIALLGCFAFFVASAWVPAAVLWRREKRAR